MAKAKPLGALQAGPYVKKMLGHIAALSESGKLEEAETMARELYEKFPMRADVNDALSLTLVDQKKTGPAIQYAEFAVKAEPRNAAYLVNLGRLYLDHEVIEDALPTLERAMACKPSPFEAAWAIADFFHETGKADRSISYYEKAIATADRASLLQVRLAYLNALTSLGRVEEAEKLADFLSEIPKYRIIAAVRKAAIKKHKADSPVLGQLLSLRDIEGISSETKCSIDLEIGKIFENSKDYDAAFGYFSSGKKEQIWSSNLGEVERQYNASLIAFTQGTFKNYRNFGIESEQPVFVVGMPRSGTTLTEQIIAAHPLAGGVGELRRIRKLYTSFAHEERPQELFDVFKRVGPEKWKDIPNLYMRLINYLSPGKQRIVDKLPHNFEMVGFMALCFPNARIVHIHRNPVDNFISAYQNHMSVFHGYSFDQVTYAKYYLMYERLMAHWNKVLPGKIFDLDYDRLVQDPEPIVRKLIDFLGLEWSDDCLRFHEKQSTIRTFSKYQVRSAVNSNSVERWRNYEKHLGPMLEILGMK